MKKMRKTITVANLTLILFCGALLFTCNKENAIQLGNETQTEHIEQFNSNTTAVKDEVIYYSDFGAKGDGKTDDFDAIIVAHSVANERGAIVKADKNATYYIGDSNKTAIVQTSTYWDNAQFIIDDSNVDSNRDTWVFNVCSSKKPQDLTGQVQSLSKGQKNIGIKLDCSALIVAIDSNTKDFIRTGLSADDGINKTDIFQVDENGNVEESTPILKDFETITSLYAYPIDNETLTVSGGTFTTIANRVPRKFPYFTRGIYVSRSNAVFDGIVHNIRGEGDDGVGYNGFIKMERVSGVTVQNCILSGRKSYRLASDELTSMGSYDFVANLTLNLKVRDCSQANSINDDSLWGIMASNLSKNISFYNVHWSRFDAHQGVYNATIKNSTLRMLSIIGTGKLHIENTTVTGRHFIYFRDDYGSSWDGEVFIKNCVFAPPKDLLNNRYDIYRAMIFYCLNNGQHYYGYETKMPTRITIDGFTVEDDINRQL